MLFFYQPNLSNNNTYLEGEEYQHCIKVLRKRVGDDIGLLDGKGKKIIGTISEITNKRCTVEVKEETILPEKPFYNHVAIAPTKNMDRMEWFVEKTCELGIDEISFLQTKNSERTKLRIDRLEKKAVSALKQSKNGWLTRINPLAKLTDFLKKDVADCERFIAVVEDDLPYFATTLSKNQKTLCLIGPEGDFSPEEVERALNKGFKKVSLGKSTLRTETAGLIACHFVNVVNKY